MFENAFNNIDRFMRNDEGLASELDYAEQTSWLLFLKYLDDLEAERRDDGGAGRARTTRPSSTRAYQLEDLGRAEDATASSTTTPR